jgi:DNA repair protein RecN (Recombination protein N)
MIRSLSITNYAIIEAVEINFSDDLTIITGETGAGKSIMLGALGLIMGKRAETKVLYDLNKKCVVEATFDINAYKLEEVFHRLDLDYAAQTIIRREISPNGKTRAFINDSPVRLDTLRELCDYLVDLHQQFDTLDIQDPEFQLKVIDALANNKDLLAKYQQEFQTYEQNKRELERLKRKEKNALKESDFLQFQLNELLEAELVAGEQEELEQEQKQLSNAEDIKRILNMAIMGIAEDERAISSQMLDIIGPLFNIAEFHKDLPALAERLEGLKFELEEIANDFSRIADNTEYDPERLQEIDERLDMLFRLQKKHNVSSEEELIEIQEELQENLQGFEDLSGQIVELEKQISAQEKALFKIGAELSAAREAAITPFEKELKKLLQQLSMKHARLQVDLQELKEITPTGTDQLRFLFAANKGSRLEEIRGVASGGEMSRLALCIKSMIADAITLPTLIFDEIDTGVSGEVALQMGIILQGLSKNHQVISITHSPQIAAKAHRHYFVHKTVSGNRTITDICELAQEERIMEIAKMLSGDPPSEFAKANAKELLVRS